ncbi:MAG: hypothetical protein ACOVOA_04060, partial [Allorhizobium sp.]
KQYFNSLHVAATLGSTDSNRRSNDLPGAMSPRLRLSKSAQFTMERKQSCPVYPVDELSI